MIRRAENVEPSKPRASGRSAGTSLSIGMAGTVENARRKSPETKLGKKSRYQAFRKIAPQQHQKQSRAGRSQTIEPSGRPQGTSSENARGTNFRPSLSSLLWFSATALSALGRRRPGRTTGEQSGREHHSFKLKKTKCRKTISSKQPKNKEIYAKYAEDQAVPARSIPESDVRRRRARRSRDRVDRSRGRGRGRGRGARPAKRAVDKASARHEPNGSRPGGPNSSIHLETSASLSVALRAVNDFTYVWKVPLRDVVDLKSRGCRKLRRGNTGVPSYIPDMTFMWACVGLSACCTVAVGMSVCCTGAFENQRKCGLQSSRLCSGWHTKTHRQAHAQKHRSWLSRREYL